MKVYPGFSIEEFFTGTIIPIDYHRSKNFIDEHGVYWNYNSFGYRTHEFENISDHALVTGCSLTEGHGLQSGERWADHIESLENIKVFNLAKGGSNSEFCYQLIRNWIKKYLPKFVIVQWPNVFRKLIWNQYGSKFAINSSNELIYSYFLKSSDNNFYQPWLQSVIHTNLLCQDRKIPLINVYLEPFDSLDPKVLTILESNGIKLYMDHKRENDTWYFDSASLDNIHHSAWCNEKWSQRLKKIINQGLV